MNLTSLNYVKFKRKIEIVKINFEFCYFEATTTIPTTKPSKQKQTELMKKDSVNELWKKR